MSKSGQAGTERMFLHEGVATTVGAMIEKGAFRPGDRIPSLRSLARQMRVSINTVLEAYGALENSGMIEARPQSGYYVRSRALEPETRRFKRESAEDLAPFSVSLGDIPLEIMRNISNPSLVPLGGSVPNPELLPVDKMNRILATEARRHRLRSITYASPRGDKRLRTQIARRSLDLGLHLTQEEIVVTSGCAEAVTLALLATCRPGDTVAVESPVFYMFLQSVQWLGLKLVEIPSSSQEGIDIEVLRSALRTTPIRACIVIPNFNNPLGALLSEENKKELVELLASYDVPLIEDDVYGDLAFGPGRPVAAKAFDETGSVLYCSSFSKTLAPGYRVGWIVPGRYRDQVERTKAFFNIATASPTQLAIAEFLTNGGYDHHLRTIHRVYSRYVAQTRDAVGRSFPQGTRVTRPGGGYLLWVEMPGNVDALEIYRAALREGISVAPGAIFTTTGKFRNCLRLNAAFWSDRAEQALETLGGMAEAALSRRPA